MKKTWSDEHGIDSLIVKINASTILIGFLHFNIWSICRLQRSSLDNSTKILWFVRFGLSYLSYEFEFALLAEGLYELDPAHDIFVDFYLYNSKAINLYDFNVFLHFCNSSESCLF